MMLVSKDLKRSLALLTLGATLMTGCASGPGTGFTRFWPQKDSEAAVAHDEELAAKWRARIDGKSEAEIIAERDRAATESEVETREKSRLGFLRFPWNRNKQAEPETTDEVQKLEERLAQLEAEKRLLMQDRKSEQSSIELTKRGSMDDPFLKAEQQNRSGNPFEAYAQTNPVAANRAATPPATGLPKWAEQPAPSADRVRIPAISATNPAPARNEFASDVDASLKNLGTEVARETAVQDAATNRSPVVSAAPFPGEAQVPSIARTAPSLPDTNIAARPDAPEQSSAARPAPAPTIAQVQPTLDRPIVDEEAPQHPLANLKTVADQRRDWATLEVQQLMKHARIQARADQFEDAMKTVLAAEQLANNANLKFAANEQTPAELLMVLKSHIQQSETASALASKAPAKTAPVGVAQVSVPSQPRTESSLPSWPHRDNPQPNWSQEVAAAPAAPVKTAERNSTEQETPPSSNLPQWPAQNVSLISSENQKGRYIEARPGTSSRAKTQLITSGSIYSSENLRWAKLESERATLKDPRDDRAPADDLDSQGVPPAPAEEDDPFAAAFGSADAEQEALIEDVPAALLAPEIPAEGEPMVSVWDDEVFGVPVRSIALLILAGLILLAAIIHRRRNTPEQI